MRKLALLAVFALLSTMTMPARAQFCPGASPWVFDDVPVADPFCGYITWAAQNGITLGCAVIDANHRLYCPSDPVRRDQMAAFVNRLGNVRVEAVGTGPGLTGGPITGIGTISLAATQLLPTTACAGNQIVRWNGSAWVCSNDANSGGTVTSVASGAGLTGGPITTSGSLSIAGPYQLPQSCTNGQVAKSNGGGGWTCASDANSGGTVTSVTAGSGLTGGVIITTGTIAVDPTSTTLTGNFFKQGGNAFGTTAVLGTTDNNALDVRVNSSRVIRYEPNPISPNVIGGSPANSATAGVRGATIGGGGIATGTPDPAFGAGAPNQVTDVFGTVAGGWANRAGDGSGTTTDAAFATIGGGISNTASGQTSTVAGGESNVASTLSSAVGGGTTNSAIGSVSTVSGGAQNIASGYTSTVGGGEKNMASGARSAVSGGLSNRATGAFGAVPGGAFNWATGVSSLAAGFRAQTEASGVLHDGAFVWADYTDFDFHSNAANEFAARSTGGVRFVTAVNGSGVPTAGVSLDAGDSSWNVLSDRAAKVNWRVVDGRDVLERLVAMPIARWNYRTQSSAVEHMGPSAQDFRAAFGLGHGETTIATVDADGVALAAIQGLNAKLEAKIAAQEREIDSLRRMVHALASRLP